MFETNIKLNSPLTDEIQQKQQIQQRLAQLEPLTLSMISNGIWKVGFNSQEMQERCLNELKDDTSFLIVLSTQTSEEASDYELIYNESEQNAVQQQLEQKAPQTNNLQVPQTGQEGDIKSNDSLNNLSFNSSMSDEEEEKDKKGDQEKKKEETLRNENSQNINKKTEKIGSSHTVETLESNNDERENELRLLDTFQQTIVNSPLVSEEETDDTQQKIYQVISTINTTKEQRNALQSSFMQASKYLQEINKTWVSDEKEKSKDLFYANVFSNPKYQMLALGFFTFYIFFL